MDRHTHPRLNRRYVEQAYADYWLGPKGKAMGWAVLHLTQGPPTETRRRVGSFMQRQTEVRNGVTLGSSPRAGVLPPGVGVNRKRPSGRIAQEAKAFGKAKGYADVSTRVWKVKVQVGAKKL